MYTLPVERYNVHRWTKRSPGAVNSAQRCCYQQHLSLNTKNCLELLHCLHQTMQRTGHHAPGLIEEQIALCHEVFNIFDRDKDGTISKDELGIAVRQLGQTVTDEEMTEEIRRYDQNGDGRLDFNEFLKLMQRKLQEAEDDAVVDEVFHTMCQSENEEDMYISHDKLQTLTDYLGLELTHAEIQDMITMATDDGRVSRDQFFKVITNRERRLAPGTGPVSRV